MKGFVFKKVSEDIQPFLPGVIDGLLGELVTEENVISYKLDRTKGAKAIPFLQWRAGEVSLRMDSRGMNLDYVVPPGKSREVFMSKTNKILVPLMA